jgi:hypothetical protein
MMGSPRHHVAIHGHRRSDQYLWWQVAEYTFDSFMIRSRTRG